MLQIICAFSDQLLSILTSHTLACAKLQNLDVIYVIYVHMVSTYSS